MRRFILLLLRSFILYISCNPVVVQTANKQTPMETAQIPTADISATLDLLPSSPHIQSSQIVLQGFFESYNHHDLAGVLATLAETFAYGDCDFVERQMLVFETKPDLSIWLQKKFADEDQFQVIEMIIAPLEGSPANDPRSTAVQVYRTNKTLNRLAQERQSLFKIILSGKGTHIQYLNTYGNIDCEAGR